MAEVPEIHPFAGDSLSGASGGKSPVVHYAPFPAPAWNFPNRKEILMPIGKTFMQIISLESLPNLNAAYRFLKTSALI